MVIRLYGGGSFTNEHMLNIKNTFNKFAKNVVTQARANLTRQGKNNTKELYNSLDYKVSETSEGTSIEFFMSEYGQFVDQGVSGKRVKYDTPFQFKKMPNIGAIQKWVKQRGLKLRDEKGRFKKGGSKTLAFLISRSMLDKGMKPSLFFTKPFDRFFENIDDDLLEAMIADIDSLIDDELD